MNPANARWMVESSPIKFTAAYPITPHHATVRRFEHRSLIDAQLPLHRIGDALVNMPPPAPHIAPRAD